MEQVKNRTWLCAICCNKQLHFLVFDVVNILRCIYEYDEYRIQTIMPLVANGNSHHVGRVVVCT